MLAPEPVGLEEVVMCDVIAPWFVIAAFAGMTELMDIGVRTCGSSGARHVVTSLHLGSLSRLSPE